MLLNNPTNFQYYFVPNQKSNLKVQTTIADANLRYVPILKFSLCLFLFRIERTTQCSFVGKKFVKRISNISGTVPRGRFLLEPYSQGLPILLKTDFKRDNTFVFININYSLNCQPETEFRLNFQFDILKYFSKSSQPYNASLLPFQIFGGLNSAITSLLSNIAFIPTTIGVFRIKKGTIYQYVVCVKVKEGTIFQRTPRY